MGSGTIKRLRIPLHTPDQMRQRMSDAALSLMVQRVTMPRRTIAIEWSEYMDGPEPSAEARKAMLDCVTHGIGMTANGKHVPLRDIYINPRRCICCGAPANEVQHD